MLDGLGAQAVAVVGSHATGRATVESDLDLAVVGDGPHYRLEMHDGILVSVGWASAEDQRRRLYEPSSLGMHVPGWREAVLLHDTDEVGASIKQEARAWRWELVADRCDAWVAEEVTGLAEEVLKMKAAIRSPGQWTAAVERSVLALRLVSILAIHRRILYSSENAVHELVAVEMGPAWRNAQRAALSMGREDLAASSQAALRLFGLAADEVRPLLDQRQRAVVDNALLNTQRSATLHTDREG
jgi:predicted nucleotidyltransferase